MVLCSAAGKLMGAAHVHGVERGTACIRSAVAAHAIQQCMWGVQPQEPMANTNAAAGACSLHGLQPSLVQPTQLTVPSCSEVGQPCPAQLFMRPS